MFDCPARIHVRKPLMRQNPNDARRPPDPPCAGLRTPSPPAFDGVSHGSIRVEETPQCHVSFATPPASDGSSDAAIYGAMTHLGRTRSLWGA
jgi:hypothetical protein